VTVAGGRRTLKNFPKREDFPYLPAGCHEFYTEAVEKWFEGFERQLREDISQLEKENERILIGIDEDKLEDGDSESQAALHSSYYNNGQIQKLKEILGEA